jgi:hypothetical protein
MRLSVDNIEIIKYLGTIATSKFILGRQEFCNVCILTKSLLL